ncbi:hypothetical protein [Enterococcus phage vB_Efs8_KEN04]|uniref:Uncharacterized protein n=1 Tax=Enterococcus phage vB_Efs6_KEN16 TaxID=3138325 RepID=A0AAX4PUM7_9CAUD
MKGSLDYYNYLYQTIENRPTEELDILYDGLYKKAGDLFAIDNFQGVKEGRLILKILKAIREEINSRIDEEIDLYLYNIYDSISDEDKRVNWLYEV